MAIRVYDKTLSMQTKICQYMKRERFESTVQSSSLRFASVYELRKDDPNECQYPEITQKILDEMYGEYNAKMRRAIVGKVDSEVFYDWRKRDDEADKRIFIKSWFIGECEAKEMWRRYAPKPKDVLIQTSIGSLLASLSNEKRFIFADKVDYGDLKTMVRGPRHGLARTIYKDKEKFEVESEFRLILDGEQALVNNRVIDANYRYVPVELKVLFEKIIASPEATNDDLIELTKYVKNQAVVVPVVRSGLT